MVYIGFILGIVHSLDFDECIMTCTYHCTIIQNSFTALRILCLLSFYPSLLSNH